MRLKEKWKDQQGFEVSDDQIVLLAQDPIHYTYQLSVIHLDPENPLGETFYETKLEDRAKNGLKSMRDLNKRKAQLR